MNTHENFVEELRNKCIKAGWYSTAGNSWGKYSPEPENYETIKQRKKERLMADIVGGICFFVFVILPIVLYFLLLR